MREPTDEDKHTDSILITDPRHHAGISSDTEVWTAKRRREQGLSRSSEMETEIAVTSTEWHHEGHGWLTDVIHKAR